MTLSVLDRFTEDPSPADDHRQAAPVFDGDRLYSATWAGNLSAFDVSSGTLKPLWAFHREKPFRAPPLPVHTAMGKLILAPCEDKTLYALDPATGRPVWTFAAGAALVSGLAEQNGTVLAGDREGTFYALDAATGRILWQADHPAPLWYAPPLFVNNLVIQGDDAGTLIAREIANGVESWRIQLPGAVRSRPALVQPDLVAVADLAGNLSLIRAADGFLWDRITLGGPLHTSPAVLGNRLILGGRDGMLRAVDVRTRRQ